MNHGQSNSSVATTRMETTHGLTYSVARAIDITAWQSVDTVCLCCLTRGVCVSIDNIVSEVIHGVSHWTPTSSHNSVMEMARVLSSVDAISMTCSMCWTSLCAACLYIIAGLTHSSCARMCRSTVLSILISNLINKYNSLMLTCPTCS